MRGAAAGAAAFRFILYPFGTTSTRAFLAASSEAAARAAAGRRAASDAAGGRAADAAAGGRTAGVAVALLSRPRGLFSSGSVEPKIDTWRECARLQTG